MNKETLEKAKIKYEEIRNLNFLFKVIEGKTINKIVVQIDGAGYWLADESIGRMLNFLKNEKETLEKEFEKL